jgi:acetyltransferase-like isoleucine patch superfamily enzyme
MDEGYTPMTKSHGSGLPPWEFKLFGNGVVIENGVLIFHPENIELGNDVYIGHYTILKAYFKNQLSIGTGTWIGQQCFLHSAGGISIGNDVGIGPGTKILTSSHDIRSEIHLPIMKRRLKFSQVTIEDGCDLGVNCVILPGVRLGRNVQVGAGAVVTRSFPANAVVAGIPAKEITVK